MLVLLLPLADSLPLFAPVTSVKLWNKYSQPEEEWQFEDTVTSEP